MMPYIPDVNVEMEVGICDRCGVTGWLALVNGQDTCTDCEADIVLADEERRTEDLDDGVWQEEEF